MTLTDTGRTGTRGPSGPTTMTAVELVAAYRAGTLSPVEVTRAVLERAGEVAPVLNCFAQLTPERALADAAASEARWRAGAPAGPVDGVPVTVKENVAVAGLPLTRATAACADAAPSTADGPPAARTREAGGVVIGTSTMPDFGMLSSGVSSLHGITRNPWNPAWTVGGSSGGAGAAAASGCGPLHTGSDIGGSLRFPATWQGLATLKPSFGRIAVDPPYLGRCAGALGRTVADVALYTSVLARPDLRDFSTLPPQQLPWTDLDLPGGVRGLRVAVHTEAGAGLPTDPEVAALVERAASLFEAHGAVVERIDPFMTPQALAALDTFLMVKSWADLVDLPPERRERALPFVVTWMSGARTVTGEQVARALGGIQELRRVAVAATAPYDLVLSPVSPVPCFPAEWPMPANDPVRAMDHLGYAAVYNFSEQPAASVNCGFTAAGSPVGLQLAGRRFADVEVLRAAAWYETARPADAVPAFPLGALPAAR